MALGRIMLLALTTSIVYLLTVKNFSAESISQRHNKIKEFFQDRKLEAVVVRVLNTPSQFACVHRCVNEDVCWGVNVKELVDGSFICQLILSAGRSDLMLKHAQGWMFYELQEPQQTSSKKSKKKTKQYYKSCKVALENNNNTANTYEIQPLGMQTPLNVSCELDPNGTALAVFNHDREQVQRVNGIYGGQTTVIRPLSYKEQIARISEFADHSTSCRQYTYARCYGVSFVSRGYTWLSDRRNTKMLFWGGGPPDGRGCSCGITNSCENKSFLCNCDAKMSNWGVDEGYITAKEHLPIIQMTFRDAHDIHYYIGRLECIQN